MIKAFSLAITFYDEHLLEEPVEKGLIFEISSARSFFEGITYSLLKLVFSNMEIEAIIEELTFQFEKSLRLVGAINLKNKEDYIQTTLQLLFLF